MRAVNRRLLVSVLLLLPLHMLPVDSRGWFESLGTWWRREIVVGSMNIRQFGRSKADNPVKMAIIGEIVCRFDVLAIQEAYTGDPTVLHNLMQAVLAACSHPFAIIDSMSALRDKRRGTSAVAIGAESSSHESILFLYRTDTLRVSDESGGCASAGHQWPSTSRKPFYCHFQHADDPTFNFTYISLHASTDPESIKKELFKLDELYRETETRFPNSSAVFIMGDTNAAAVRQEVLSSCTLAHPDYSWLIPATMNTMSDSEASKCNANDRIIMRKKYIGAVVPGSAAVWHYPYGHDQIALCDGDDGPVSSSGRQFSLSISRRAPKIFMPYNMADSKISDHLPIVMLIRPPKHSASDSAQPSSIASKRFWTEAYRVHDCVRPEYAIDKQLETAYAGVRTVISSAGSHKAETTLPERMSADTTSGSNVRRKRISKQACDSVTGESAEISSAETTNRKRTRQNIDRGDNTQAAKGKRKRCAAR